MALSGMGYPIPEHPCLREIQGRALLPGRRICEMKKRFLSLLCVLALCLGLLPITALAAGEDAPTTLYVGETDIVTGGYWKTTAEGKLEHGSESDYNVHYDGNGTLTLNNATIHGRGDITQADPQDYGIYAGKDNNSVSLTINLIGSNTVSGHEGIRVNAPTGGNATLVIQSDGNDSKGSLEANGNEWNGIKVSANTGSASLTLNNASVEASTASQAYFGVSITSLISSNPILSLTVNGGSLTAQGGSGIRYVSGGGTSPSTFMTISDSALIKAIPGISASVASVPTPKADSESGGIVFDGKNGTVYGNVELQDDLTINEGETLTIGKDASLTVLENVELTNNGKINNNGTLNGEVGGSGTVTPKITTDSLPNGTAGEFYTATLEATGNNITWSSSDKPEWMTLDSSGGISGTPTAEGTSTFMVTATNDSGNDSKQFSLTIDPKQTVSVTGVTLDQAELSLYTGESKTLNATVQPDSATNKNVTWSSDNEAVATVDNSGKVTAVTAGEANITVKTEDGNHSADCKVTVTQSTYSISADTTALNFGSVYTGYTQPAAQMVIVKNTGNQQVAVTLPTANDFIITAGTGFTNGSAAIEPDGTATFTVQPKSGLSVGTYSENIAVTSSEGATVTITANFTVKQYSSGGSSDPTYSITLPSRVTGGELKLSRRYAEKGETVTITAIPDEGYELDTLTVTDSKGKEIDLTHKGGNEYTFKMPAGRVEIEVSFREIAVELPFTDVPEGVWYEDAAAYVYEQGLMAGTSATTFAPDATTSRSMIATILWRMAGSPVVNYAMDYTDVAQGQWYSGAIRWAASEGIVGGYGNGLFGTNDPITREQFAAMLYRFAQEQGYDVSVGEDTNILSYTDVADLSEYAISAMQWAVGAGIINGTGDGSTLTPQGQATRAQAAVMLMRFCEEYVTW